MVSLFFSQKIPRTVFFYHFSPYRSSNSSHFLKVVLSVPVALCYSLHNRHPIFSDQFTIITSSFTLPCQCHINVKSKSYQCHINVTSTPHTCHLNVVTTLPMSRMSLQCHIHSQHSWCLRYVVPSRFSVKTNNMKGEGLHVSSAVWTVVNDSRQLLVILLGVNDDLTRLLVLEKSLFVK